MTRMYDDSGQDAAAREFMQWWAAVQGTPITDEASGVAALQAVADGGAETVAVPGIEGTTVVGSVEPVRTTEEPRTSDRVATESRSYTSAEPHGAKLDEAAKRGISRADLRDYLDLLQGSTPAEIAATAEKIDRLNSRAQARQPQYDEYAGMDPVEAGTYHFMKNFGL